MSLVQVPKAALTRARAVSWQLRRHNHEPAGLRVLLYHRVSDDPDPLALHPRRFRRQMEHLSREGYTGIDVTTALDRLYAGTLKPKQIALTFDDGFKDLQENALNVLTELGFTSTVFVSTDVIDGTARYWWAPEDAALLSWDELRALDTEGTMKIEAHSLTHPNLVKLDDEDCRREIGDSKVALEAQLGRESLVFCYPGGFVSSRETDLTRSAGFRYGITCEPGLNVPATNPLLIQRIQVDKTDSVGDFAAKVRGSHDRPVPGRAHYRRYKYGL